MRGGVMFTLMVIATSTAVGTFTSLPACQAAIRQIYTQKLDPYQSIPPETLKQVIDLQMRYSAPKDYVCLRTNQPPISDKKR
jgi:hypothetical protein